MPIAPRRACTVAGCPRLRPCERHGARPYEATSTERRRERPYRRLYDSQAWRKASKAFLRGKVCERCRQDGRATFATVTDHRRQHRGDLGLFWDKANWRPLCGPCHNAVRAEQGEPWNASNRRHQ
jgi:5-methylcytosine-specific restriction enzyme A